MGLSAPPVTMRLLSPLLFLLLTLPLLMALNTAIFTKYTRVGKGCPCWFDIRRKDCACCKEGSKVMQCGWPMHHYCYKKSDRFGCPGVPNNKYTFSTRGFPCFFDHDRKDCAWCSPGGYQCGPGQKAGPDSKDGNRYQTGRNLKYCDSVLGDCRHIPACDHNAKCLFNRTFGNLNLFHCVCSKKGGFQGNGIQCVDKNGTFPNNDPKSLASLEIKLQTDFYVDRVDLSFLSHPPKDNWKNPVQEVPTL